MSGTPSKCYIAPMPRPISTFPRLLAAWLVTLSGAGRVASLWFRELDESAVMSLLVGAVYLIVGIGLFGQSRFTLFVAIAVCSVVGLSLLGDMPNLHSAQTLAALADLVVVVCCAMVLWDRQRQAQG